MERSQFTRRQALGAAGALGLALAGAGAVRLDRHAAAATARTVLSFAEGKVVQVSGDELLVDRSLISPDANGRPPDRVVVSPTTRFLDAIEGDAAAPQVGDRVFAQGTEQAARLLAERVWVNVSGVQGIIEELTGNGVVLVTSTLERATVDLPTEAQVLLRPSLESDAVYARMGDHEAELRKGRGLGAFGIRRPGQAILAAQRVFLGA